jgi:tetratricopeptide (TPR) repeat protein
MEEQPDLAIRELEAGLAHRPEDPRLLEMLGYVHLYEEAYDPAYAHYRKAEAAIRREDGEPERANFWFNYGLAAQQTGHLDLALEHLSRAVADDDAFLDAYVQYMSRKTRDTDRQTTIDVLGRLLAMLPGQPGIHYYLGLFYSYGEQYEKAAEEFEAELALADREPGAEDVLGANFYFWFGAACERTGRYDRAEELFERSLELDPENAEAYNYVAYMWAENGENLDRALEYVEEALSREPENGAFLDTRGWIYYRQGRYEAALHDIQLALEKYPDDPTIVEHLGDVQLELGHPQEARTNWEKALRLDPDNQELADKLREHGVDVEQLLEDAGALAAAQEGPEAQPAEGAEGNPPPETAPVPGEDRP